MPVERPILAVSFDCYGTLIDWQTGLLAAVRPVLAERGVASGDGEIVRMFALAEREAERPPHQSYREVLREVMGALLGRAVRDESDPALDVLWRSIGDWPAFADTPGALRRIGARCRVCVASNVDDDLFEETRPKLGIEPDEVVTAAQVRSYKPGRAHFDELLRRLGLTSADVLHAGESRYHDVEPASAMGFRTAWVNRQGAAASASGEGTRGVEPTYTVGSMGELADLVERLTAAGGQR